MNPAFPILGLLFIAVIASLLSAHFQRQERKRQGEVEFKAEFKDVTDWLWPEKKEEL